MSTELNHIYCLFDERARNDFNSTTLANTLDKDIQTVFNSPEKFVMELLQNADDASNGNDDQSIDVTFQVIEQYLMFSHTGKHFDHQDVEAICDNAQQHYLNKKLNLNKTGYKGIGFKSVFVISERVYIKSNKYCFRFDSQYSKWNSLCSNRRRYPWQIIPIWTHDHELPGVFELNNSHVNFIFQVKQDKIKTVTEAVYALLRNPYTILFLRRIRQINIAIDNKIHCLELRKPNIPNEGYLLYINKVIKSRWLMISKQQEICRHVHQELQELKDHECPVKLKRATSVEIRFAIQLRLSHEIKSVHDGTLFCYLPTQVDCNLPFLVNADFLLSADRMQLLSNIWNTYLFECIAKFHIESLQTIAQKEQYRNDILTLFAPKLKLGSNQSFINIYNKTIETALDEIAFIPSYLDPSRLLRWPDAIADKLEFFINFPNVDPSYQSDIASYTLKHHNKLCNEFTRSTLVERIHKYAKQCLTGDCYEKLLGFMISTYPTQDTQFAFRSFSVSNLANQEFLLTIDNKLVSSNGTFIPFDTDIQVQASLSLLNANFIHPKLLKIPDLKPWLKGIGISDITEDALIQFIKEWLSNQRNCYNSIQVENSITIFYLLTFLSPTLIERENSLINLPLITKSGILQPAKSCYLPSILNPKFDLEEITENNTDIVSYPIYSLIVSDRNKLRSILISLKVKEDIEFFCDTFYKYSDKSKIDYFNDYFQTFKDKCESHKFYQYHMAYLPFMRCLKIASYAKVFFKYLQRYEKCIIIGMANFKISSSSNRCNYNHDGIHYLKFMLNREPCVFGRDGQLYRMQDLYLPSITDNLDKKLKSHLPHMQTKYGDDTIELSDELIKLLGARQNISHLDTVKLFNAITDEDADRYRQIFQGLYEIILQSSWNTTIIGKNLRQHQFKLLASDGSRQPAALLYTFSYQYVRIQPHPNIFQSIPDITKQSELELCRCLGVQILESTDYIIHCNKSEYQDFQKDAVKILFKMTVITVSNVNLIEDKIKLYHEWISKFEKLQIIPVQGLFIRVKNSKAHMTFKADVIISVNHCLFYEEELDFDEYVEVIAKYIELPPEQVEILQQLASKGSDEKRLRYLSNHHYDTGAIAKLDGTFSQLDDDDLNPNLTGTGTFEGSPPLNNKIRASSTIFDSTVAHCSYGYNTDKTLACRSQDYNDSQKWSSEPAAKKSRLSKSDGPYHLIKGADEERIRSPEDQGIFESCLPADVHNASVKFIRFEDNSDPSSDSIDAIKLERVLTNVDQFDYNNLNTTTHINDIVPAEIHRGESHQRDKTSGNNQWTGRWGEELTYIYFVKHYEGKFNIIRERLQSHGTTKIEGIDRKGNKLSVSLTWFNCIEESNQPADISITKNDRQLLIEVKTTYKSKDLFVKISHMQWKSMRQYGKDYRLCCVYNAGMQGDSTPIIKQIKDPASKFLNGTLIPREIHFKI